MMPKIRIVHKGLILVAVPLIFGIGYISLLFSGLLETSRLIDREFMLKDAGASHLNSLTALFCAESGKAMYVGTNSLSWKEYYVSQQKRAVTADKHVRKLLKNERSLVIPKLKQIFDSANQKRSVMTPLLLKLQEMSLEVSKKAAKSLEWLRLVLWGGVIAGLSISGLLAMFFCLNISNRLLIIVNNALSLTQGRALNQPFKGSDEIAELDQLLYNSATEIRQLERFKKEMVGVVSHELKSPLSSVGSFLSSLSEGVYGELTEKSRDKTRRTFASVKRLMGLVAELLYLDRLELDMNPEQIRVEELLASSLDSVHELSEKSGIEIKVINQSEKEIRADRNRLVQVIVNLISNALKFSPQNGVVTLETLSKDGLFECRISDQGRGIPESYCKQIFEPFKQVDGADSTTKKGTGLGLTISRSIVEQHGGQIGVDSEPGKGSTFWFKIPQLQFNEQSKQRPESKQNLVVSQLVQSPGGMQSGKFRVLYQGLIIIALPVLLQLVFAVSFNSMLDGLWKQTEREDNSMRISNALNQAVECIARSLEPATFAVYLPIESKVWANTETRALGLIDKAIQLSKDNNEQVTDLNNAKQTLKDLTAVFEHEAKYHESRKVFDKLDFNYRKKCYEMAGLKLQPANSEEAAAEAGGMNPMVLIEAARALVGDYLHTNYLKILDLKTFVDRTADRERAISQKAAKQRTRMINELKLTLLCAIVATVTMSTLIAFFLLRSISKRLQHIIQNTERLARRETLVPAIVGHDEIGLLDRVLFETGNRLMELEVFKRELVAIVSHELRTPLLSISSALELFDTGALGDFTEKGKNRLKFARGEADRLIRLINDLLDIEKMEAGKFVLDFSEVATAELLETSKSAVAQLADSRQLNIETKNLDSNLTIMADSDRLCQVFINLLSNAIKYSPEGGTIVVSAEKITSEQVKFSITDQGRGIPEELRQRIFDRFVQVEKSDATERGGTGLGLAICKAIVEQHGGKIGVDSQPGAGSTFWFTVPIQPAIVQSRQAMSEVYS